MKPKLKPIEEQTIVVTGAASGIGLATARMAAEQGARVVLVAREESDLEKAVEEIRRSGGRAEYVVADVGKEDQLRQAAEKAVEAFGGVDTWVNNAGVSIYGRIEKVGKKDAKRLFDTNYWGVVYGSLIALEHLKERGGALINIGSVLSDRAIILQGHYSASKHAVKGFTDALRMEIEKDEYPISVTLVKPSSIATPYTEHAANLMDEGANLPPPVYSPDVVAETILACAQRPVREITVGAGGWMISRMGRWMPDVTDKLMEKVFYYQEMTGEPNKGDGRGILHRSRPDGLRERGNLDRRVLNSSLYTTASLHPVATLLGVAALGAGIAIAALRR